MKNEENKIILNAELRKIIGKKARKLREKGLLLGNIYGEKFKSQAISINLRDFLKIYKKAKETKVISIKINGEEIPVLINHIQRHPVKDNILHVDFRKIDLKKKIQTEVPLKIIGISDAVEKKGGVLLIQAKSITIEALPENIPENIEVDISKLTDIGQEIKVSDLKTGTKYEIKDDSEKTLVSIVAHKEEEITPETTAKTPEVISEKKTEVNEQNQTNNQ